MAASKKHLFVFRFLHSLSHKLLSKSWFISGNYNIEPPRGEWTQRLSELSGNLRWQGAAVKLSARLVPVSGRRCLVRLNLGHFPSAALHKIGIWNAQSMRTDEYFTGQSDVRIHAYLYMRGAAPQVKGPGECSGTPITLRTCDREKGKPASNFEGLPCPIDQGPAGSTFPT